MHFRLKATCPHIPLSVIVLGSALAAACGGGAPAPKSPEPATTPSSVAQPSSGATAPSSPPPAPSAGAITGAGTNVPIVSSKMTAELTAVGIDWNNPDDLSKMDGAKKRKLMPLFVRALGMQNCTGCHVEGNFKADTHNKRVASAMWSHFVRDLRLKGGGGTLFCDSCHQGKIKLLDRSDKKALSVFMRANYEDKIERADHQDHSCETCHSDPFEGKILAKVWKIAP